MCFRAVKLPVNNCIVLINVIVVFRLGVILKGPSTDPHRIPYLVTFYCGIQYMQKVVQNRTDGMVCTSCSRGGLQSICVFNNFSLFYLKKEFYIAKNYTLYNTKLLVGIFNGIGKRYNIIIVAFLRDPPFPTVFLY